MSKHLFGIILTPHGVAANNRGGNEGNITTLQKILWHGEQHTTVSAEAIRWAIRWFWQNNEGKYVLNRTWVEEGNKPGNHWKGSDFSGWLNTDTKEARYLDDDALGFMSAKAAEAEGGGSFERYEKVNDHEIHFSCTPDPQMVETGSPPSNIVYKLSDGEDWAIVDGNVLRLRFYISASTKSGRAKKEEQKELLDSAIEAILKRIEENESPDEDSGSFDKEMLQTVLGKIVNPPKAKGTTVIRRARLEVARAVSLTPWEGELTFNAASIGATPSASSTGGDPVPYGTEVHATRYQYGFALTPESLDKKAHAEHIVDAIVALGNVGGNHARFLFDFSPETVVFRLTDDFAPRMLYGFGLDDDGKPTIASIIAKVHAGDICSNELVVGGVLSEESAQALKDAGVENIFPGVRNAGEHIKKELMKETN